MDGRGGCCIARYGGGAYDMSKVDRIMMRFRPIAPKPANVGSVSCGSSPEMSEAGSRSGRGRRRFTSANGSNSKRCNNGSNNRKRKGLSEENVDAVVTLPLLPETPDCKDSPGRETPVQLLSPKQAKSVPTWLSFGTNGKDHDRMVISGGFGMSDYQTVVTPHVMRVVVGSCVTVECITDAWVDADGLGCTDDERRTNLERDTCPGMISDGFGRVTWTNEAYRKMVGGGEGGRGEVVVWLVMKDKAPVTAALGSKRAFTCRVRVQNHKACGNGKERSSITVPCDVWRMEGGGFAWRLDVKAALSLGR
ncbi:uncharacterized protein LOC110630753 [Manihot esculenta]|uniref:DUF7950 domain-containing protein n=1 Tax=Manihot esculenta TaxID=3983 RepID=A0A251JAI4_MANES|nr:uncharacterized protein LOC110630753 [Manihot esculenta]OAY30725.1 hypothetical protein MANES_14G054200v8 [Manihot esculenta]